MRTRNIVGIGLFAFGLISYVVTQHFSFAADKPHSGFVHASIEFIRDLSIRVESRSVSVPKDIDSPERLRRASGNYDAMCATCHLKPGVSQSELSKGLYPTPPNLTQTRDRSDAASDFWVVKHGIKGSGMPSWGKVGLTDDEIWDLVAFIRNMPTMDSRSYANYVKTGLGHHHSH